MKINRSAVCLAAALVAIVLLTNPAPAQNASRAEALLQAARNKGFVDGDLQAALDQYKKILASYAGNRTVTATALVEMGRCYEKLGHAEARKAYERVVRDFAEQREAASEARTRLAALGDPVALSRASGSSAGVVARQVWANAKSVRFGTVSPDGRYLVFHDADTGDLLLRDFSNGEIRRLSDSRNADDYPGGSVFAPDGKQVAYAWSEGDHHQLRVIRVSEGTAGSARVLYENADVRKVSPHAWSPDGQWIAVQLARADRTTQIGLISPVDRLLRVLKSVDWRGSNSMFFSPDGRYLAFDLPSDQDSEQHDVFVLAIDGSREIPAVVHPADDLLMGWTQDGTHLLFSSDRSGSPSLWAIAFQRGVAARVPQMMKPDMGRAQARGTTQSGALYFALRTSGPDIYTASVDFNSGNVLTAPVPAVQEFVGSNREASWSPDGKYLSYKSVHRRVLAIRSVETGKTRYISPDLAYWYAGGSSPDGRFRLTQGTDRKGRQGIYRIDAKTGAAEAIALNPPHISFKPQWAPDGKRIFYGFASSGHPTVIVERDIATGQERELLRRGRLNWWSTSPDGQYLAWTVREPSTQKSTLSILALAGGEPRELVRLKDPERFRTYLKWTPDSRSILYQKAALTLPGSELWFIGVAGGQPRKIDLGFADLRELSIHPDGKQVIFHTTTDTSEVWVMENFLPASSAGK